MQIKTTLRFHLYPSEWLRSIKQAAAHAGEDVEQGEYSTIAGGSANLCGHYGNQLSHSSGRWNPSTSSSSYTTLGHITESCPTTETLAQPSSWLLCS